MVLGSPLFISHRAWAGVARLELEGWIEPQVDQMFIGWAPGGRGGAKDEGAGLWWAGSSLRLGLQQSAAGWLCAYFWAGIMPTVLYTSHCLSICHVVLWPSVHILPSAGPAWSVDMSLPVSEPQPPHLEIELI